MWRATKHQSRIGYYVIQSSLALGFAVLLGLASLRFSPLFVLGALVAAMLAYAVWKRPEIGLLAIVAATSSLVSEDQLPLLSVGISLYVPDLLLLGLFALIAVRWLVEPEFRLMRTPLDMPLLLFVGVMLLSTMLAISQSAVEVEPARRAIRGVSYYLAFFVVTNLIRDRHQISMLLNGLFAMATLIAGAMAVQFVVGDSVKLIPGRVETLWTQGVLYEEVSRINPPGWPLVMICFPALLCVLLLDNRRPLVGFRFLQLELFGVAILVTFLRSYWAALFTVLLLLVYLLKGASKRRYGEWFLLVLAAATIVLVTISIDPDSRAMKLVNASSDRLGTLSESGTFQGEDGSLNWRMVENSYAVSAIAARPLIGFGMATRYRPWDPRIDPMPGACVGCTDFRRSIHNGHLLVLLRAGLLGYLSLLWLSGTFLIRGLSRWRNVADQRLSGVVLGFSLAYLALFIALVVNGTFDQWRWTPVIGIMMGVNEVILLRFNRINLEA